MSKVSSKTNPGRAENTTAHLIRSLRKERRMTQKELADEAGVSFSFVNEVERGKNTVRLDKLNQILKLFGYEMAPVRRQIHD